MYGHPARRDQPRAPRRSLRRHPPRFDTHPRSTPWCGRPPGRASASSRRRGSRSSPPAGSPPSRARAKYQIVIEQIEPAGAGALMALLEERRKKLAAEGLFAAERKKKLPYLPRVIGVVTSPTGAVIRDILHRLDDRFPTPRAGLAGARAGRDRRRRDRRGRRRLQRARPRAAAMPRPDLLIVARGGGSIEDLWSFNEEIVVRAVAASRIPVISGVGHETDTTLVDYAADHRAPDAHRRRRGRRAGARRAHRLCRRSGRSAAAASSAGSSLNSRDRLRAAAGELPRPLDLLNIARQRLDLASSASRRLAAPSRPAEAPALRHRRGAAVAQDAGGRSAPRPGAARALRRSAAAGAAPHHRRARQPADVARQAARTRTATRACSIAASR